MVQCETEQAVRDVEAVASIKGLDLIFVGPYDLSLSLGIPGDFFHPKMIEAVDKILAACKTSGKIAGIFVSSLEEIQKRIKQGFTFFAYSIDTMIFSAAMRAIVDEARARI